MKVTIIWANRVEGYYSGHTMVIGPLQSPALLRILQSLLSREKIRVILGLYRDNEKENGNYCLGFRV